MTTGHLYRVARADVARVRALAIELFPASCWAFGAAAAWDFDPERGRNNLRKIIHLGNAELATLDLSGDFGHIFGTQAELRWRRRDEQTYDVLVLSETPLNIADADELRSEWIDAAGIQRRDPWRVEDPGNLRVLQDSASQDEDKASLSYLTYHAPNGAVQFLRYTGVRQ